MKTFLFPNKNKKFHGETEIMIEGYLCFIIEGFDLPGNGKIWNEKTFYKEKQ